MLGILNFHLKRIEEESFTKIKCITNKYWLEGGRGCLETPNSVSYISNGVADHCQRTLKMIFGGIGYAPFPYSRLLGVPAELMW
jgi:hypothetical protein